MKIQATLQNSGKDIFYSDLFLNTINDLYQYFKNNNLIKELDITPHDGYKYEGDFYGLLSHLNIPKQFHMALQIINEIPSSVDFLGRNKILVIDSEKLIGIANTLNRIEKNI